VEDAVSRAMSSGRVTRDLASPGVPALTTRAAGDAVLAELER
jgi:hypothetical protein